MIHLFNAAASALNAISSAIMWARKRRVERSR